MSRPRRREAHFSDRKGMQNAKAFVSPIPGVKSWKFFWGALLIVVILSGILNFTCLDWGLPNGNSWHSDSIAGNTTLNEIPRLFGTWTNKYPRLHFIICGSFYKWYLADWQKHPVYGVDGKGNQVARVLDISRMSKLILVSNTLSALMGVGAVMAVFLTARLLFGDILSAFLPSLALACSHIFVFYSHLGNLDVPCTFWIAWSIYWAVKAAYLGRWHHYILLGVFCACAVCTKDPAAGFVVGIGFSVWLGLVGKARDEGRSYRDGIFAVFTVKVLAAILALVLVFALLNGIFTSPRAFLQRMGHWIGGPGTTEYTGGYRGQWPLLVEAFYKLWYSVGWPFLLAIILSLVYSIYRIRWKTGFAILPLLCFYLVVVMRVHQVQSRYLIPGLTGLVLLLGISAGDFLRWSKVSRVIRVVLVGTIYGLSFLYCMGGNLEMAEDSRIQVEKWFEQNVSRRSPIVAVCPVTYAPRLHMLGFRCDFRWSPMPTTEQVLYKEPIPEYLIMSEKWYTDSRVCDQKFVRKVFKEELGYKKMEQFSNKYLYPKKTLFGVAGWPMRKDQVISPDIYVFQKK